MAEGLVNPGRVSGGVTVSALSGAGTNQRGAKTRRPGDMTGQHYLRAQAGQTAAEEADRQFESDTAELVGLFSENKDAFRYLVQHQRALPVLIELAKRASSIAALVEAWDSPDSQAEDVGADDTEPDRA